MPLINQVRPSIELPTTLEQRWQALRLLEAHIEEALSRALQAEHQLSVTEYAALAALGFSDDGGHLRQQFLADSIPLNQSSVSRLVGRLEKLGLTERYLCPQDRRGVYTQISEKGQERLAAARETWIRVLEEALGRAAEDAELAPVAAWLSQEAALPQSR